MIHFNSTDALTDEQKVLPNSEIHPQTCLFTLKSGADHQNQARNFPQKRFAQH